MNHTISRKRKIIASLVLAAIALLLYTGCARHDTAKTPEGKQHPSTTGVAASYKAVPVTRNNPEYQLSLPGELEPYEQVAIYAKVEGFIKKLYVDRGDKVRKGQLLAILEAPEMNQQYISARAGEQQVESNYRYAQQAYDRLVEASKTNGAVAAIEIDRARSAMESAKAAYNAAKAKTGQTAQMRDYLRITAPFDGMITERNVSVGALTGTSAAQPIFMMAQGNKLRLTLSLPERHAASVHKEMEATFTVSSQPGKTFKALLSRTSGLLSQADRSLVLEFDVDNSSGSLKGGDYAQVTLSLQRQDSSYWIPNSSILNTQSGTFVLTSSNQKIRRIPVREGIQLDTLTEVFGTLSPHDSVLLKPSEEIKTENNI